MSRYISQVIRDYHLLALWQIYTSSERRVISSAEIFAAALLDPQPSGFSTLSPTTYLRYPSSDTLNVVDVAAPRQPLALIVRKDLLDDSNAAKDLMDDVKKRLKILLRPGEPEKRPELTWPKSMGKEPVDVVKVIFEAKLYTNSDR